MGMLAGVSLGASLIWGGVVLLVLLLVGWLAARLMPGERTPLVVELPPLRLPVLSNVLIKTAARLEWYIKEAVPLFLFGTGILFVLDKLGCAALDHRGPANRSSPAGWDCRRRPPRPSCWVSCAAILPPPTCLSCSSTAC